MLVSNRDLSLNSTLIGNTTRSAAMRRCCVACGANLDIHQLEMDSPERLLGTCDRCGKWHLIFLRPELDEVIVAVLPDSDAFWLAHADGHD